MPPGASVDAIPHVVVAPGPSEYLEVMTRAVFQTGLSWKQIATHWDAYGRAFAGFEVARVAAFTSSDIEAALAEPGVLRSRRKIAACVNNARALLDVARDFGTFGAYVARFADYPQLAKDMHGRFAFMGAMNVWYVLFRTGHPVPRFEEWVGSIPGEHPRMREMVERARAAGLAREVVTTRS